MAPGEFRLRMCYQKSGRIRFLSHLEVMRALERSSRRAALPYAVTKGFNPRMKAAFGPALPVGTEGEREYWDVWLRSYVSPTEVLEMMRASSPENIAPLEARYISDKEPSLSAGCTIAMYEVLVVGKGVTTEHIQSALDDVVKSGEIAVERKGKTKIFDLARSLPKEPRARVDGRGVIIEITIRTSQEGSLRPVALVGEMFSRSGIAGAVQKVVRKDVLIEDEDGTRRPV